MADDIDKALSYIEEELEMRADMPAEGCDEIEREHRHDVQNLRRIEVLLNKLKRIELERR